MTKAALHDGSIITVEGYGQGPAVLLPVSPAPVQGPQAEAMRQWGADPALGHALITGLRGEFRVLAFDYEGQLHAVPKPDTLTPDNVAHDLLAVADAARAETFAYYGYSWLGLAGMQLALRTDRLTALVMGGFPPIDGPYAQMLRVTAAAHAMAVAQDAAPDPPAEPDPEPEPGDWSTVSMPLSEPQTRQYVTLYRELQAFDDRAAQEKLRCARLCFAGSADEMVYGEKWGNVDVSIAGPFRTSRAEMERLGWEVHLLDGLDHMQAMQSARVLPIIRPWLASTLRP
jgi:pimeloyl-ACP methyl ester carboxylesterase